MDPQRAIQIALQKEQVVEFSYGGKLRTLSPFEEGPESVIGWDHGRDEVRRYRYDKMANLRFNTDDEEYVQPQ